MYFETPLRSSYELPEELTLSALEKACGEDEDCNEVHAILVECVYRYYEDSVKFEHFIFSTKCGDFSEARNSRLQTLDDNKRKTHTALCNMLRTLARELSKQNIDVSWLRHISGAVEADNREVIGKWAIRQATRKSKEGLSNVSVYCAPVAGLDDQGIRTGSYADSFGL